MTRRSEVAFRHFRMVILMGKVGREALEKNTLFVHHFCMISSNSGFSDTFLRCLEIPRGVVQFLLIYDLWGGWCCWLRVVIAWHRLLTSSSHVSRF